MVFTQVGLSRKYFSQTQIYFDDYLEDEPVAASITFLMSGSIDFGSVVGAYRLIGLPSLSTKNLLKYK